MNKQPNKTDMFLKELFEILSKEKILIPFKISQTSTGKLYVSMTNYMCKAIMSLYRTATKQPSCMKLMFSGVGFAEGYPESNENKLKRKMDYVGEKIGTGLAKILMELRLKNKEELVIKNNISNNLLMLFRSYNKNTYERFLIMKISIHIVNDEELKEMVSLK